MAPTDHLPNVVMAALDKAADRVGWDRTVPDDEALTFAAEVVIALSGLGYDIVPRAEAPTGQP